MEELKACPFCPDGKGELCVEFEPDVGAGYSGYSVRCRSCFAKTGIYTSEQEATHAWNRRSGPENVRNLLETIHTLRHENENLITKIERMRNTAPENKRMIDADVLSEEIKHLGIFLAGESIFTPAIKETVLRTIDEQPTVSAAPESKALTNADRIRSMSNEELAAALMCPNEMGLAEIECDHSDNKNCCKCLLDWLNQPEARRLE